jgi:sirohydrochlorin ferrochelatase
MQVVRHCSSLCLDPAIVALSAERFHQSIAPLGEVDQRSVALALIGRGSSSTEATSAMLQFTEQRVQATPVGWYSTGFIHAQRPTVDEALDGLAATGLPWLVVQPHLLFEGELVEDLRREVEYRQSFSKSQRWLITGTLGAGICTAAETNSTPSDARLAAALCKLATIAYPSRLDDTSSNKCLRCGLQASWCAAAVANPQPQVN